MHDRSLLVEERIDRLLSERLVPAVYRASSPLSVSAWQVPGEPVPFAQAVTEQYDPFAVGRAWGRPWSTTWFRISGEAPAAWMAGGVLPDGTRAEIVIDLGFDGHQPGFQAEGLLWRPDGTIIKAISPFNTAAAEAVDEGGRVDILLEAAANPDVGSDWSFRPTVVGDRATAGTEPIYTLRRVDIALLDVAAWELVQDVRVLRGLVAELSAGSPRRAEVLAALEKLADVIDPHDVAGTAVKGRAAVAGVLARPASASAHILHATGHAHIDSAWLWPVRETVRKVARTFSNVVALMDAHPEFVFAASSAQQFAWIKEHYPVLFERIREKVAAGQFVPVGGMWVESDTNLPGGEAMARQFVYGKRFFLEEFGVECEEVWLPDSFGYSGALPQIARAAGARWFLTQKISWNETNTMPHHTFLWEGIDGSRIFTHFPPVDKYNSDLDMADIAHAERNFADHGRSTRSLLPYGYGDGGGGPTREMVATVARTESLEGSPRLQHSTPRRFFEEAEAEYPNPEVWVGELYLESHRGVYTSQLRTKQGNRRSEHLLREAELWATMATVRADVEYPRAELDELWKLVLLQQFHDILPGSSIAWVHQDAERNYAAIAERLERLISASIGALAGTGDTRLVFNAAPHERAGAPAMGAAVAGEIARASEPVEIRQDDRGFVLDNGIVRVRVDVDGLIVEARHLASGRDLVPPGEAAGLFQLHRDTPNKWDAWDIDHHYRHNVTDLREATSVRLEGSGTRLIVERAFSASTLVQTMTLLGGSNVLELDIEIDWHERQKLLKLAFPLDVHSDRFASEIQFGHLERATHSNTSWDAARYETSAHRWIHVSEPDFGAAIVNDSTYGYDVRRMPRHGGGSMTVARLSILRSALFPDPGQDQGRHRLRVGLVVGATRQNAVTEGYRMNLPQRIVDDAGADSIRPLLSLGEAGVVVEALKLADDGSGDLIVRLYEALGHRTRSSLQFDLLVETVIETDLLERALEDQHVVSRGAVGNAATDQDYMLELRAFELVTLRVRLAEV